MNRILLAGLALAFAGSAAVAEQWKDWMPGKGVWQVTMVHVDPNHVDDYLVGLKRTWVPGAEIQKRKGLIDDYMVMVSDGVGPQPNVILATHVPNFALLEPNQTRDQQLEQETYAATPKTEMDAKVSDFEKYRTFVGSGNYSQIRFSR